MGLSRVKEIRHAANVDDANSLLSEGWTLIEIRQITPSPYCPSGIIYIMGRTHNDVDQDINSLLQRAFPGGITIGQAERIEEFRQKYTEQQILKALHIACSVNKTTLPYIEAVLNNLNDCQEV